MKNTVASDHQQSALENENRKLRKINQVLVNRVERDMDAQGGNAFSLFQTAITLESRVAERTAELTRLTHRLMHEISERRAAEDALRVAKIKAEQANLSKTKFLAAASHDLHQPLNAARLFLGVLTDEVQSPRARELTGRIEAALDTVGSLLDELLDMSKLDAGVWPVRRSNFAVAPILERLRQEYGPQIKTVGLELRVVPTSAVVYSDAHLFERVMRNLVSNALRYTGAGRILIGCRRRQSGLRVEVWDTGIGISDADRLRIFGEFERLGKEPRRREKGLGLGLSIVERISTLLDLQIDVRSQVGQGSVFALQLPYGTAPPARTDSEGAPLLSGSLTGKRIAVIENDEQILEGMRRLLQSWGCVVVTSTSTRELVEKLSHAPDLIIADHHLNTELGTEAIGHLCQHFGIQLPALVISSDRSAELTAEVKALGYGFLAKPMPPARMRAMMSFLLKSR